MVADPVSACAMYSMLESTNVALILLLLLAVLRETEEEEMEDTPQQASSQDQNSNRLPLNAAEALEEVDQVVEEVSFSPRKVAGHFTSQPLFKNNNKRGSTRPSPAKDTGSTKAARRDAHNETFHSVLSNGSEVIGAQNRLGSELK